MLGVQDTEWRQTKKKNTTQHKTLKNNSKDSKRKQNEDESRCSRRVSSSWYLQDTQRFTHIVKSGKRLVGDRGKYLRKKRKYLLSFDHVIFRKCQPVRDNDSRIFVVMTRCSVILLLPLFTLDATYSCLSCFYVSSWVLSRKALYLVQAPRTILSNINSICWWCWNIATDEREVNYLKSEVITFFVEFCFWSSFFVDFNV